MRFDLVGSSHTMATECYAYLFSRVPITGNLNIEGGTGHPRSHGGPAWPVLDHPGRAAALIPNSSGGAPHAVRVGDRSSGRGVVHADGLRPRWGRWGIFPIQGELPERAPR